MSVPPAVLLILITAIAAGLRFWSLSHTSLWIDEVLSIGESDDLRTILWLKGNGFGYFFILHWIRKLFGTSELSLRFFSALLGTLTIPLVWLTARRLSKSPSIPLIAASLVCVLPAHVYWSRTARMYSAQSFLLLACLYCILWMDSERWGKAAAAGSALFLGLAFSFHNFTCFYWPALMIAAVIWLKESRTPRAWIVPLFVIPVALGILLLGRLYLKAPNLLAFLWQWAAPPFWHRAHPGISGMFWSFYISDWEPSLLQYLFPLAWFGSIAYLLFNRKLESERKPVKISAALFLIPFLLFLVLPIRKYGRLLIPLSLFSIYPLAAAMKNQRLLVSAVLLALTPFVYHSVTWEREPWKAVCAEIEKHPTERTVISVWPALYTHAFRFCYNGSGKSVGSEAQIPTANPDLWAIVLPDSISRHEAPRLRNFIAANSMQRMQTVDKIEIYRRVPRTKSISKAGN